MAKILPAKILSSTVTRTPGNPRENLLVDKSGSKNVTRTHENFGEETPRINAFRQVERFVWTPLAPKRGFIAQERYPDWLLSLRVCDWSEIGITSDHEPHLRALCPNVFKHLESILVILDHADVERYIMTVDIVLVSGSETFVANFGGLTPAATPVMAVLLSTTRSSRVGQQWKKWAYKHSKVGGVTSTKVTMCFRGVAPIKLGTFVERALGHVLKFSERPKSSKPSASGVYLIEHLLDRSALGREILYETHMCHTGWGRRILLNSELADAFDLPSWCEWHSDVTVPVKVCLEVLQVFLHNTTVPLLAVPVPEKRTILPKARSTTWLPTLQRTLPGTWADPGLITAKAAKGDNARVATSMWDDRITLAIPGWTDALSNVMRTLVEGWQGRRLYQQFRDFMRHKYGSNWSTEYVKLKIEARITRSAWASPEVQDRKRYKGGNRIEASDHPLLKDGQQGAQALSQYMRASWWEWKVGSTLLFWRWNGEQQQRWARDGMPMYVQGRLPTTRMKQRPPPKDVLPKLAAKIDTALERGYFEQGLIKSHIEVFEVKKDDDIRPVYNGTKSGLNAALWAPSFFLPTANSALRVMSYSTFMVDLDLGEMFLNFPMQERIRQYSGVDITSMASHLKNVPKDWEGDLVVRWTRQFMGMKPAPYNAVRSYYLAEEFARGNPRLKDNPMRYDRIKLNLPGNKDYDPSKPRVMKWNDAVEEIAGDVKTFVDDLRANGFDFENSWQVARQLASRLQYLGIQDAARKRRPPSQDPGAWAGGLFAVMMDQIIKSVTQEKWDKGRAIMKELAALCDGAKDGRPMLSHKDLERKCGFLVHLAMTFGDIMPFLKEIYVTLNIWRTQRGADGWKLTDKQWIQHLHSKMSEGGISEEEFQESMESQDAPTNVKASPGFAGAVRALNCILGGETAPQVLVRANSTLHVYYGFGDASGKGFGSGTARSDKPDLSIRIGTWGYDESGESSNWREFTNVVEAMEEEGERGNLKNCIVFFFTDNSTVEAALYSGTSSSKKLLDLVIRFKSLQTKYSVIVHVSHVAGTRMIVQGTDGISRGKTNEGVMSGEAILTFIPTHLSAIQRSTAVEEWIRSWLGDDAELLKPIGWFERAHDVVGWSKGQDGFWRTDVKVGKYIWAPAPAAAAAALEELRVARIKRQDSTHLFIVPRLMTPEWLKQLYKASDIVITVPVGQSFWPKSMHEPLLIDANRGNFGQSQKCIPPTGNCLKCGKTQSWTRGLFCANFAKSVGAWTPCQSMWCGKCYTSSPEVKFFVAEEAQTAANKNDRERLDHKWKKRVKNSEEKFHVGRRGDHLMVAFECDLCVFRKLKRREPKVEVASDKLLLISIRRINLDACWARAALTVTSNANLMEKALARSLEYGLTGPYLESGPLPDYDHCGYEVALQMVGESRQQGKYSDTHKQWDSVRKLRTVYSNQVRASAASNSFPMALEGRDGKEYVRIATDPCASMWFRRFFQGCKERMGQDVRPNRAMSLGLMHLLLRRCLSKAQTATNIKKKHLWTMCGAYYSCCYVASLRGPEGRLMDLAGIIEYWNSKEGTMVLALRGKIKGENKSRTHLLPCVNVTGSGVNLRRWMSLVVAAHRGRDRVDGPAFSDWEGNVLDTKVVDAHLHEALGEILDEAPDALPHDLRSMEAIKRVYHSFRSFRRTSETQAVNQDVSKTHRDVVNRWGKEEKAGVKQASLPMDEHYAQVEELWPAFRSYTSNM